MNKKICTNKNKGFSLVELIVVIAIMAVLTAVLSPALLQYVEKSRAQKDDSAMGEVTNAVKIAMADQDVYDELLTVESGKDAKVPSGYADTTDEVASKFAGEQRGVTITFRPVADNRKSVITMADGYINAGAKDSDAVDTTKSKLGALTAGDGKYHMIGTLENICGKEITLVSQTYRNSDYTIFIKMGTLGAEDASISVKGEWNGTNLPKNAANGGTGGDEGNGGDDGDEIPVTYAASFAENDWGVIANACQKNEVPSTWNVGDEKSMTMTINGVEQTISVRIIGKNHDTYANGGTAPLTFMTTTTVATHKMNSTNTNEGGWDGSEMYKYLNDETDDSITSLLESMDADVRKAIKPVKKKTNIGGADAGGTATTTRESADKLFLLSCIEVDSTMAEQTNVLADEGSTYSYFTDANSRKLTGASSAWWLRSPRNFSSDCQFSFIYEGQNYCYNDANNNSGVAFAFCF